MLDPPPPHTHTYTHKHSPASFAPVRARVQGGAGTDTICLSLFSRWDRLQLERIVGQERAERLLGSDRSTHLFI